MKEFADKWQRQDPSSGLSEPGLQGLESMPSASTWGPARGV